MNDPLANDFCSVCHNNFNIPCQANCSHWFCGAFLSLSLSLSLFYFLIILCISRFLAFHSRKITLLETDISRFFVFLYFSPMPNTTELRNLSVIYLQFASDIKMIYLFIYWIFQINKAHPIWL